MAALVAWVWFGPLSAWRSIEHVSFNPDGARQVLADIRAEPTSADPANTPTNVLEPIAQPVPSPTRAESAATPPSAIVKPPTTTPPAAVVPVESQVVAAFDARSELDVFLILGSDEKTADPDIRADTIMLLIVPGDRSSSMLVSIPRALLVTSPCHGGAAPINVNLEGCETVTGLDLMGVAVEDYTGLTIDHLVLFDFNGFETIIDRMGGLEICVDHAIKIREQAPVFLEPGCSTLDGAQALSWVRERQMLDRVNGEWQLMADAGDAGRTDRQRVMVRQLMGRADQFESPAALTALLSELSGSVALDTGFGIGEALELAWDYRSLASRPAYDVRVSGTGAVSPAGDLVLIPDRPFAEYLEVLADP